MKPGWIIGLVMLFVVLQLIAGICELTYIGASEIGTLQTLMSPTFPEVKVELLSYIPSISIEWDWMNNLWSMFWFDYPFFYDSDNSPGGWMIARYVFFIPVSVGIIVSLILAVVRGVA